MSNHRYNNGSHNFSTTSLRLLYISTSKYEKDWHSTMHSHQYTELFYVVSGQGEFQVEKSVFPVGPGDIVIINANIEHTERSIHQSPMEYIVLSLEGGDILLDGSEEPHYFAFNCGAAGKEILFYIQEILKELDERPHQYSAIANNMLEILCIKLQRYKAVSVQLEPSKKSSRECAYIKRYIDNNFAQDINLDLLAGITHLNKYYLAHAFTREFGISPINYLTRKRIQESLYYLTNTNYRITQIAQLLGFSSASYFTQCFMRLQKISPRDYRQKH